MGKRTRRDLEVEILERHEVHAGGIVRRTRSRQVLLLWEVRQCDEHGYHVDFTEPAAITATDHDRSVELVLECIRHEVGWPV